MSTMSSIPAQRFVDLAHEAMERHGINQCDLERATGIHRVTINRILRGHQEPTVEVLDKLAKALKINVAKIF